MHTARGKVKVQNDNYDIVVMVVAFVHVILSRVWYY